MAFISFSSRSHHVFSRNSFHLILISLPPSPLSHPSLPLSPSGRLPGDAPHQVHHGELRHRGHGQRGGGLLPGATDPGHGADGAAEPRDHSPERGLVAEGPGRHQEVPHGARGIEWGGEE